MTELTAAGFAEFFQALWGKPPFAWQVALAERVCSAGGPPARDSSQMHDAGGTPALQVWPQAIALPTAAGKTAVMDIAVYALAASLPSLVGGEGGMLPPRRIFFVVDRRVIVDEAYERARQLAEKLRDAETGILKQVADRLRTLSGTATPLVAHQLRGGILRSEAWARSPVQPMIVASTVDQIGSRLLFRAYGPGHGMRPIHAGLIGNDSLILLDEAHCVQPFLETLQGVTRYRQWADAPLPVGFHVTVMSATPPETTDVFHDTSDQGRDRTHPLGRRQLAAKPTLLLHADKPRSKKPDDARAAIAKKLVAEARRLAAAWPKDDLLTPPAPAVVIFCNRVDTARKAFDLLAGEHATLLTGRMRPLDKDDIVTGELAVLSVDKAESRRLDRPHFVVATQTLEVGANLDFDLLVSECASLDALRQRFGRLNRLGRDIPARAAIVAPAEVPDDDPVYGEALRKTWNWLQALGGSEVDFGVAALAPRLPVDGALRELNAPAAHAPVLLPAHVDALAQTAPEPRPSPEVALFLHGPRSGPADVSVCWRGDLVGDESFWTETVSLCPPTSPECLAVPYLQMRRWLAGEEADAGADVEGEADEVADAEATSHVARKVVRWRGRGDVELLSSASELRPGDVLVIPASAKGWEKLATLGNAPVADLFERAQARMRGKVTLRLHPELLRHWPESERLAQLRELAATAALQLEEEPDGVAEELRAALLDYAALATLPAWLNDILLALPKAAAFARNLMPHPTGGLLLRVAMKVAAEEETAFSDEDDIASSGGFRAYLPDHLQGVADYAVRHARLSGLSPDLVNTLAAAGYGHDLGKADPRFQAWLRGGFGGGPLLAKSVGMKQSRQESERALKQAGYPKGGRHELLSVRLLESNPDSLPKNADTDLLLHLVESHHGHCRPFAPVVVDENPRPLSLTLPSPGGGEAGGEGVVPATSTFVVSTTATGLERLDAGPAERYWRLTRRYGWWGLAWLETLLRLADHRRSAWEENNMLEEKNV